MQLQETIEAGMNDESAMLRVKNGEVQVLDVLFLRHSRPLFSFFYGLSRNPELSEDLVQEVFWRILRYRETFNEKLGFRSWLYRIARNLHADRLRQEIKHSSVNIDTLEERVDHEAPTAFQVVVEKDDRGLLLESLDALASDQREILILARFEGLSFKEIGEILGCNEGTAKVRAFRALQALREQYRLKEGSTSR